MRKEGLSIHTAKFETVVTSIYTTAKVYHPFRSELPEGIDNAPEFTALWDTGATMSCISDKVIDVLGLIPDGTIKYYSASGVTEAYTYYVCMMLPNNYLINEMFVVRADLKREDIIIGMDIISRGDFVITNKNGRTTFSFQIPSTHEIDFEKDTDISSI